MRFIKLLICEIYQNYLMARFCHVLSVSDSHYSGTNNSHSIHFHLPPY